jgi:hypothetical protein
MKVIGRLPILIFGLTIVAKIVFADVSSTSGVTSFEKPDLSDVVFPTLVISKTWNSKELISLMERIKNGPETEGTPGYTDTGYTKDVMAILHGNSLLDLCALVQLKAWYNDGGPAEVADWYITKHGKKMMAILRYSLKHPAEKLSVDSEKLRCQEVEGLIKAVTQGAVIGCDEIC